MKKAQKPNTKATSDSSWRPKPPTASQKAAIEDITKGFVKSLNASTKAKK